MTERQFKTTPQHQPDKTTPNVSNTQASSSDLVQLQRYLGNQGVQRLLAKGNGTRIQAKLSVNAPGDKFEVEADKVSKEVARMPYGIQRDEGGEAEEEEMQLQRASDIQREDEGGEMEEEEMQLQRAEGSIQREDEGGEVEEEEMQLKRAEGSIQREDEGGEMEEEEMQLQRASSEDGGFEVGGEIENTIQAERGGGQAMGEQARGFFESGMGHDFSNVKVHDDSTADQLNQSVSARAFTIGSDIFFRSGEYQPESQAGRELMAHELTHVVQQGGASVKKDDDK